MLNKLLKYDLKYMIRNMSIFYILSIFFAITTRIIFEMEQSVMIGIIGRISLGCMFAMIANTLINSIMRSWVRFRDSLYKDEAYLTHTLPVTKNELYNSKFIQTFIFFFISFIVVLISLFIVYYSKDNWLVITNYVKNITSGLKMSTSFFVFSVVVLLFLEIFNAIQCGFLGMIIGYNKNNGKLGFSVLFGFVSYIIVQNIVFILTFIYGLFDSSIMELFKASSKSITPSSFKVLAILVSVIYFLIIIGMSVVCKSLLNKGVNIE